MGGREENKKEEREVRGGGREKANKNMPTVTEADWQVTQQRPLKVSWMKEHDSLEKDWDNIWIMR